MIEALAAFAISFALTPLARHLSHRFDLLDKPTHRGSHTVPTPRIGGVAIVIGAVCAAGSLTRLVVAALAMAIVGLIDDATNLRAGVKFVIQIAAVTFVLFPMRDQPVAAILALGWIVYVTNAFNFMDGINGIASLEAVICGVSMGLLLLRAGDAEGAALCFAVAGAAAGFFPWNAFTGSIFMGDSGSLFLGFFFAAMVVRGGAPRWLLALPLLPFLLDTGVTLARRILRRERFWEAHRMHFYQHLTTRGWSHLKVTLLYGALALLASAAAFGVR